MRRPSLFRSALVAALLLATGARHLAAQAAPATYRGRATKVGAVVGGIGGAGLGFFFGLLAAALCDSGDCPGVGGAVAFGVIGGAVGGAITGGVVGAAIPARRSSPAGATDIVELGTLAILGGNASADGGGAGLTMRLAFRQGRFSLGPEYGAFGATTGTHLALSGGSVRVTAPIGGWQGYGVGGLAGYTWYGDPDSDTPSWGTTLLGGSLGAGMIFGGPRKHWAPTIEGRVHRSLANSGIPGRHYSTRTLQVGVHAQW